MGGLGWREAKRGEFAHQLAWRHSVPFHGPVRIHHDDEPAGFQAFAQMPEEFLGLCHLMVHVDQEDSVERMLGKHRIGRFAEANRDIVQTLALNPRR